ncbi:SRPBCC family protein [soil metagenome]
MASISRARTFAADPQKIWDVLADFGAISTWAARVDHSCLLGPAPDEGSIGVARRLQVGRNTLIERIVEFEAPHRLAYDIEGLPRAAGRLRNHWELRAMAPGLTAVTLTSTVDIGSSPPARLAERVVCRVAAKQSDELLTGLAASVEDGRSV